MPCVQFSPPIMEQVKEKCLQHNIATQIKGMKPMYYTKPLCKQSGIKWKHCEFLPLTWQIWMALCVHFLKKSIIVIFYVSTVGVYCIWGRGWTTFLLYGVFGF